MMQKRHFRNFFPEPKFQRKFLFILMGGCLIQMALVSGLLLYFLKQNYTILVTLGGLDPEISQILYGELRFLVWTIGAIFLLYWMGIFAIGMMFSHRIAGPVYAMKRVFRDIADGKDAILTLRNYDEFQDVVEAFNIMIAKLKTQNQIAASQHPH